MKRIFSYAMIIALLFTAETVLAQGYTFRVLANKGSNKLKKANTGQLVTLKTGATLNTGDALIAEDGAYIGLMHKSGKTIEVRKAGTLAVADLEKKVTTGTTTVASRYAKFVSDKMNETESGNYKRNMNATGAISRGTSGSISLMLDGESPEFLGNVAVIRWNPILDANNQPVAGVNYTVKVKNIFDVEVMNVKTDKSSVVLDFTKSDLQNEEGLYIIEVSKTDDPEYSSAPIGLRKKKGDDVNEIMSDYQSLKSEVSEDSPLSKLIFASFFEEKGLLLDALTQYEEAIKMAPEITDFQELYKNFLITNGLSPE
jgi:hypothetical protein